MADEVVALRPGETRCWENGERVGRSVRGWAVRMRRRICEPGFVVTTDEPDPAIGRTEVIAGEWGTANDAFDRMMRQR